MTINKILAIACAIAWVVCAVTAFIVEGDSTIRTLFICSALVNAVLAMLLFVKEHDYDREIEGSDHKP